jgi:hypothetical protein
MSAASSHAVAHVPFNYTATPKMDTVTPGNRLVYAGEDISVYTSVTLNTRDNQEVSNEAYTTKSKLSAYEIVSFVLYPDSAKPKDYDGEYNNSPNNHGSTFYSSYPTPGSSCSYYTGGTNLYRNCLSAVYEQGLTWNAAGRLTGNTDTLWSGAALAVDDAPAGTKYCVAVSVWPSTSHDKNGQWNSNDNYAAMDETTTGKQTHQGGYWQHNEPHCFDIAKKPSEQLWADGVFSQGRIITSQSLKAIGFRPTDNASAGTKESSQYSEKANSGARRTFGSFAEYGVIAKNAIFGFGSGAAFGYEMNNGGTFAKSGGIPSGLSVPNACVYSKYTVTNRDCYSLGNSTIPTQTIEETTIACLISRYSATSDAQMITDNSIN